MVRYHFMGTTYQTHEEYMRAITSYIFTNYMSPIILETLQFLRGRIFALGISHPKVPVKTGYLRSTFWVSLRYFDDIDRVRDTYFEWGWGAWYAHFADQHTGFMRIVDADIVSLINTFEDELAEAFERARQLQLTAVMAYTA